ncbi:MAG: hypothetical protein ACON35_05975 [Candidatus Marinamargulisbacteria bacterium]
MGVGGAKGQSSLHVSTQRLGELRTKVKNGETLFPMLDNGKVKTMLEANEIIQTLLMGDDKEVSTLIHDTFTLTDADSVTGETQVVEMDSKIQLEVKNKADGSYELIAMLVRDTIEESEEKLAGMQEEIAGYEKIIDEENRFNSQGFSNLNEGSTITEAQLKLTALKSEAKILAKQISQRKEVRANQANDVFEKWDTMTMDDNDNISTYEDEFKLMTPDDQKKILENDLAKLESMGDKYGELSSKLEVMLSKLGDENPQDSSETKLESTGGKSENVKTASKDNDSKSDAASKKIKDKWENGFTIKQGNETWGVQKDNFMSYVEDNDINPFEAKKMLQEDIQLLGNSQSELKQQLQEMFNKIDSSWV